MRGIFLIAVLTSVAAMTACGTILQGSGQRIEVSSSPAGALVKVNGQIKGQTPVTLDLKRKQAVTVTIEMDGYQTVTTTLKRKNGVWLWGNIALALTGGGLISLIVDSLTGAIYVLEPGAVHGQLVATMEAQ